MHLYMCGSPARQFHNDDNQVSGESPRQLLSVLCGRNRQTPSGATTFSSLYVRLIALIPTTNPPSIKSSISNIETATNKNQNNPISVAGEARSQDVTCSPKFSGGYYIWPGIPGRHYEEYFLPPMTVQANTFDASLNTLHKMLTGEH